MQLGTERKLATWLLVIAVLAMAISERRYHYSRGISAMYSERYGDKLDRSLRRAAGEDAVNCGRKQVRSGGSVSDECVLQAAGEHRSFYASYAIETTDSTEYRGIARNAAGAYNEFRWTPGEDVNAIYFGPDPAAVRCESALGMRTTWQGIATCTEER